MLRTFEDADPYASARRYRARARHLRRKLARAETSWGCLALLESDLGPHSRRILGAMPKYRAIVAIRHEIEEWEHAAREVTRLHDEAHHYPDPAPTRWRAPRVGTPEIEPEPTNTDA